MVKPKILIAYGTRYGCTEIFSQKIAALLKEQDFETTVVDLRNTKKKKWPSIEEFDAVLVGSGIRMNKWVGAPKTFLKNNRDALNKKANKFGLFVSSGTAIQELDKAVEKYLKGFAEKNELQPDIYDSFGAIYDLSESSKVSSFFRGMLRKGVEDICTERGIEFEPDRRYEFINEDRLHDFVKRFVALIKN